MLELLNKLSNKDKDVIIEILKLKNKTLLDDYYNQIGKDTKTEIDFAIIDTINTIFDELKLLFLI